MTDQQIIEKAMEIALKNGWNGNLKSIIIGKGKDARTATFNLICSHDFAKALWGIGSNGWDKINKDGKAYTDHWQYHLQQMVISDDPIKYLGETLKRLADV